MAEDGHARKPPNIVVAVDADGNTYLDGVLLGPDEDLMQILKAKQAEYAKRYGGAANPGEDE
jgi:hypothetical protein